jgi:hypothetical protein
MPSLLIGMVVPAQTFVAVGESTRQTSASGMSVEDNFVFIGVISFSCFGLL